MLLMLVSTFIHNRRSIRADNSTEGKFRPTEAEVDALGPNFRKAWDRDFKNAPDRPLMIIALYHCFYGDHSILPDDAEYVSMANWTAYPYSRGHVLITGPGMKDEPDFDTGWLKDPEDVVSIYPIIVAIGHQFSQSLC